MAATLGSRASHRHPVLPDTAVASRAKANVRKPDASQIAEGTDWMRAVGRAVERAVSLVGWSLKEVAVRVKRDEREVAKWFSGERRPQFDLLFAIPELRKPLVISLAGLVPEASVSERIDFHQAAVSV